MKLWLNCIDSVNNAFILLFFCHVNFSHFKHKLNAITHNHWLKLLYLWYCESQVLYIQTEVLLFEYYVSKIRNTKGLFTYMPFYKYMTQNLQHTSEKDKKKNKQTIKQNKWNQMKRVHIFFYASYCDCVREKYKHSLKPSFEVDHRLKLKTMKPMKCLMLCAPHISLMSACFLVPIQECQCSMRFSMANQANHTLESNSISPSVCLSHSRPPILSSNLFLFTSVSTTSVSKSDFR